MKYKVRHHKILTRSTRATTSLLRKGYALQAVSYFINGSGAKNYTLIKHGL